MQVVLPDDGQEYVETSPSYSRDAWHTPTRDEVFSPGPNFSPAYSPGDQALWSLGCSAGNGEQFTPCGRTTINLSEVSIALLRV